MKCPKCYAEIKDTIKYCNKCGYKISNSSNDHDNQYNYNMKYSNTNERNNYNHDDQYSYSSLYSNVSKSYYDNHNDQYSYSSLYSNMYAPRITSDEDYIKNYVGTNYEIIKKENFSLPGFIFGPLYLIYRKMWSYTLLFLIFISIVYYIDPNITSAFYIITCFFLGFKINSIYMQYASRKVDEIKISNPDKSSTEMLEICKKKGGTFNVSLIVFLVILTLLTFTIAYQEYDYKENYVEEKETIPQDTIYNMNYEIFKDFKTERNYANNYRNYKYEDDNNNCNITISAETYTSTYTSIEDYIVRNLYINSQDMTRGIETVNRNGYNWKYLGIISNDYNRELYYIKDNTYIYTIELSEKSYYNNTICKNEMINLIDSISFNTIAQ